MRSLYLLLIFLPISHGELNHRPVDEEEIEHVVHVSYRGKRTEVSMDILNEIHQNSDILETTLITRCAPYETCEDKVELWSGNLQSLRVLYQYGVYNWELNAAGSGFNTPFGSTGVREYRQKLTRKEKT